MDADGDQLMDFLTKHNIYEELIQKLENENVSHCTFCVCFWDQLLL